MFREVLAQRFVDRSRIAEHARNLRFQEHNVGALPVALEVPPSNASTKVIRRDAPERIWLAHIDLSGDWRDWKVSERGIALAEVHLD